MAQSQSAQLNQFSDQDYRPLADKLEIFYTVAKGFLTSYAANGLASLATADASNTLSQTPVAIDGRPPVTGSNLINFKAAIQQIVTAIDTTLVTGVGTTALAQADVAQVNGIPK